MLQKVVMVEMISRMDAIHDFNRPWLISQLVLNNWVVPDPTDIYIYMYIYIYVNVT